MTQYNGLLKKSGLYFIGNFSSKMVNVALIPLYAFFLSTDALGIYDYLLMLSSLLVPFAFLAMWEAVLRYALVEENEDRHHVIGTSGIATLGMIAGILFLMILFSFLFPFRMEYIVLVSVMVLCEGLARLWQYYARGLGYSKDYVSSSIVSTLLNFALNILLLCFFDMGYYALFFAYSISQLTIMIILESKIKVIRYFQTKYLDFRLLKQMLVFSLPLVINLSSTWVINGYARTAVFTELGAFESGIYAFASKFGTIVLTVGSVFSLALIEEAIIKSKEEGFSGYFNRVLDTLVEVYLILLALMVPAISIFYHIIGDSEYAASVTLFPFFLFFAMLTALSTSVGAVFQAAEKTKYQAASTLVGGMVAIGLTHLLMMPWGIVGVAVAQLVGAAVMLTLRLWAANKLAGIKISFLHPLVWSFVFIATSVINVRVSWGYNLLCFAALTAVVIVVHRHNLASLYRFVQQHRKRLVRGIEG